MVKKKCCVCKKNFLTYKSEIKRGRGKFCSPGCANIGKNYPKRFGEMHSKWKGGESIHDGYIYIYNRNHPFCDQARYVKRSRLIMEKMTGRYLKPEETVHHKNGIKNDDSPENLELFKNRSTHRKFHVRDQRRNKFGQFINLKN